MTFDIAVFTFRQKSRKAKSRLVSARILEFGNHDDINMLFSRTPKLRYWNHRPAYHPVTVYDEPDEDEDDADDRRPP